MPLFRISLRADRPASQQTAIAAAVHRAAVQTLGIPPNDRFQIIERLSADALLASADYLDIERRDAVIVQVTLVRGRPAPTKAAFFAALAAELASAGVRREDLLVTLTENGREDWSLGLGEAQLLDEHLMRRHGWALPTA
ncbi:tautomerase family protein [Roseateles sp.]|uniref:tautomerase family protein n=1 Tax=Roseateles sp. TaxID=1971397 RepID=UPI0026CE3292